jgi:hypothetical protein
MFVALSMEKPNGENTGSTCYIKLVHGEGRKFLDRRCGTIAGYNATAKFTYCE